MVQTIFEDKIPFNRMLGVHVASVAPEAAQVRFDMRPELVGHFVHQNLHGGVTAAVLDLTGGLAAFLNVLKKHQHLPFAEKVQRFNSLGTIDLRVDYLRPGQGRFFLASGYILRTGNRVAVTRMELHNDSDLLIAVGTGAYSVG